MRQSIHLVCCYPPAPEQLRKVYAGTVTVLNIFETSVIYVPKVVHGNQLDSHCNWSDAWMSILTLLPHTQHALCVIFFCFENWSNKTAGTSDQLLISPPVYAADLNW